MSRFGRNYLQVGIYTEMLFPEKGVRFIAVNNSIDSDNPIDNDFTPFLNIMNVSRFVELIKKYRNITELTDEMLYEFIERVEIHDSNGVRGKEREQRIDIYFNFIGNFITPITEEETEIELPGARRKEAERLAKKEASIKRSSENRKKKMAELKERAKTYPVAKAEYEAMLEKQRIKNLKYSKARNEKYQALKESAITNSESAKRLEKIKSDRAKATRKYLSKKKVHLPFEEIAMVLETII